MKQLKKMKHTKWYMSMGIAMLFLVSAGFAAGSGEVLSPITKLIDLLFDFMRLGGIFCVIFGIVKIVTSFQTQDGSQKLTGFMFLGSGVILFFVKEILALLGISA